MRLPAVPAVADLAEARAGRGGISCLHVNLTPTPLLNEGNYVQNPDGTLTIDLPWIGFAFYGPNRVAVNVVDTNYYDFLRTQRAQQGRRPGEIPNVRDHVDGGTGLFASLARVESDVNVLRSPATTGAASTAASFQAHE